jgi:hypothetical protein
VTKTLAAGTHAIKAVYSGDAGFIGSTSAVLTQAVNPDTTCTSLTSSLNPSLFGQTVAFTANVQARAPGAGTPTGTVTFYNGTTVLGSVTITTADKGIAKLATSPLSVGRHVIGAVYSGDANFKTSASPSLTQQVNASGLAPSLAQTAQAVDAGIAILLDDGRAYSLTGELALGQIRSGHRHTRRTEVSTRPVPEWCHALQYRIRPARWGSSPIRAKTCGSVLRAMLRGRLTGTESSTSSPLDNPWRRYQGTAQIRIPPIRLLLVAYLSQIDKRRGSLP